ncbi:MAG: hypothetical protein ACM3JB_16850 [Acidobacteriaceae bacterium]
MLRIGAALELWCLCTVISTLSRREEPPTLVFNWILRRFPPAWKYPEDTTARIEYFGHTHAFVDTTWRMRSPLSIWRTPVGAIEVHDKARKPTAWEGSSGAGGNNSWNGSQPASTRPGSGFATSTCSAALNWGMRVWEAILT